jgi:hypothetical protein
MHNNVFTFAQFTALVGGQSEQDGVTAFQLQTLHFLAFYLQILQHREQRNSLKQRS